MKDTTYDELLEACMTQNKYLRMIGEEEADVNEMQKQLEVLRYLQKTVCMIRKFKAIDKLKADIRENISDMIELCKVEG